MLSVISYFTEEFDELKEETRTGGTSPTIHTYVD